MPTLDRVQAQIDMLSVGMPIADDDLVANPLAPNPVGRHSVTADYADKYIDRWFAWDSAPGNRKTVYVIQDDGSEYCRVEYEPELGLPAEYHDVSKNELREIN
jgi:hypothetical protein